MKDGGKSDTEDIEEIFSGGGTLGEILRSKNWSSTSLGPVELWPPDLKKNIRSLLAAFGAPSFSKVKKESHTSANEALSDQLLAAYRYERIVESNIIGATISDFDGNISHINDYLLNLLGYDKRDFENRLINWNDLTPSEFQRFDHQAMQQIQKNGKAEPYEKQVVKKDRTRSWVYISDALLTEKEKNIFTFVLDITHRKNAEEALKESEMKFSTAFHSNHSFMVISKVEDGTILEVNDAFCKLTGFSCEDLIGKTSNELGIITPEDREKIAATLLRTNEIQSHEIRIHGRNGIIRDIIFTPLIIEVKGKKYFLSSGIDITDRKQAEKALKDSESQFRQLAESLPQLVWITRADGYHEYFNQRWYEFTGVPEGYTDGDMWSSLLHPDDYERTWDVWNNSLETGEPYSIEYRFKKGSDNTYHWFLGRAMPVRDEQGKITRWFGTCTYINEQKQAEEALKRSEESFIGVLESMPDAFISFDRDLRYTYANKNAESLKNFSRKELLGKHIKEVYPDSESKKFISMYEQVIKDQKPTIFTFYHALFDNWYEVRAFPTPDGVSVFYKDVTAQQKTQQELAESNERHQLVNKATHDIIWDWNLKNDRMEWNDAVEAAINRKREDMPSTIQSWHEHIHPKDKQRVVKSIRLAIESGEGSWVSEYRFGPIGGPYRTFIDRGLIARDENGNAHRMIGSMFDLTERKQLEEEQGKWLERLSAQHQRLNDILSKLPVGVMIANKKGLITYANEYAMKLYGTKYPKEGFENYLDTWEIYHPDGRPFSLDELPMYRALKGESSETVDMKLMNKNGKAFKFTQVNGVPLFDKSGKPSEGVVSIVDITDRKQLEQALYQSEMHFRTIANNISQLAWMTDAKGWIYWYNQRWYDYTGTTLEEVEGWGWQKVHHPDHLPRVVDKWRNSFQNGEVWEDTFPMRSKDGNYRWFLSRAIPITNEQGVIVNWFGTNTDITELREAREKDIYQRTLLEALLEVSPLGVLVVSQDGRVLTFNNRFLEMWKMETWNTHQKEDERIKAAQSQLKEPEKFAAQILESYNNQLKNHEKLSFKDGRIFERYGSPVIDTHGKNYGYVWFFMDITEHENLVRQKDDFIGIASHELKTPVSIMKGYINLMERSLQEKGDKKESDFLLKVDRQINRLTNLINELLDVTKIEAGKMVFANEEYDFDQLVLETVESMQKITSHKIINSGSAGKILKGDRNRTGQVIVNIIQNAIKYTPHKSEISVMTTCNEYEVVLEVKDRGIGIPEKDLPRIFDRFYRVRESSGHKASGLGLGLYISAEIIKRQSGKIWVRSKEGEGTVFGFTLPIYKGAPHSNN